MGFEEVRTAEIGSRNTGSQKSSYDSKKYIMQKVIGLCLILSFGLWSVTHAQVRKRSAIEKQFDELRLKLGGSNQKAQLESLDSLRELTQKMLRTTSTVSALLSSRNPNVRAKAAGALSSCGAFARDQASIVIRAIKVEKDEEVLRRMVGALASIGPGPRRNKGEIDEWLRVVIPYTQHKNPDIRRQAVATIGAFEDDAVIGVPALIKTLNDTDPDVPAKSSGVATIALLSLRRIGPAAHKATDAVFAMTKSKIPPRRVAAYITLAEIAPDNERVFTLLIQTVQTGKFLSDRAAAAVALGALGAKGKKAIPELIKSAQFRDNTDKEGAANLRMMSIQSLAKMGPAAKRALPVIREAFASDPNSAVRTVAEFALRTLEKAE